MSEKNERRCEFTVRQSAELQVKGQKASLFYSRNMRFAVALWVIGALLVGVTLAMYLRLGLALTPMHWVLVVMLPVLILYRLWWVWSTLKTTEKRFRVSYPDGPLDITYWIEGDRFYGASIHGESSVLLSSLMRLRFHRDVVLLYTDGKMIFTFPKDSKTEDEWRELCTCIRQAHRKFQHPFR